MRPNTPEATSLGRRRAVDPFAALICPALRTALRDISAELAPEWVDGPGGGSSIELALLRLALRLDGVGESGLPPEVSGRPETQDPRAEARLLVALRRGLLDQWRRKDLPVSEDRLLSLLHAIDLRAEELVERAGEIQEVRSAEPEKFQFVAEIVHDLRSPLNSILFLSEALKNGYSGSLTELQERQLGLIYSAALGLMGVVNDLMTAAEEQTSDDLDEAQAFSLPQTFDALHEMLSPMAEAKQVDLRFVVRCFGHRIGHAGLLGRVLLNLTTNAINHSREGGSVEVLANSVARGTVEISVRDTGRGMSPEELERVFRPFQKSPGRDGFYFASSGLGLSIVRRLLKLMGSELSAESEVGQGTRFSFLLRLPPTE